LECFVQNKVYGSSALLFAQIHLQVVQAAAGVYQVGDIYFRDIMLLCQVEYILQRADRIFCDCKTYAYFGTGGVCKKYGFQGLFVQKSAISKRSFLVNGSPPEKIMNFTPFAFISRIVFLICSVVSVSTSSRVDFE